jgi:hypothetical protein
VSQQINLYNPLFLKKEKHFSARAMLQALGLVAAGLAALHVFALVQTRDAERLAKEYAAQVAAQRDQLVKLGARFSPQARSKALEAEVARLDAAVKARRGMLEALTTGELGNSEGFSRYFAAFGRQTMNGVWLTGFMIGESGNDLQVRGRVLHPDLVPAYLRALNREDVMRGRQVTELRLSAKDRPPPAGAPAAPAPAEPGRYVEFSIAAPLHAPDPDKKAAKGRPS